MESLVIDKEIKENIKHNAKGIINLDDSIDENI